MPDTLETVSHSQCDVNSILLQKVENKSYIKVPTYTVKVALSCLNIVK